MIDLKVDNPALIDDYLIDFVERYGKPYNATLLPDDLRRGELGYCFDNCLYQALSNPQYRYIEGIAITLDHGKVYKQAHAWLTDSRGINAYDPTWFAIDKKAREVAMPTIYMGMVLDTIAAAKFVRATGMAGVIGNRTLKPRLYKQVLKASGYDIMPVARDITQENLK